MRPKRPQAFTGGSRRRRQNPAPDEMHGLKMTLTSLLARLRPRRPPPPPPDPTSGLSPRAWADLPVYHPRCD